MPLFVYPIGVVSSVESEPVRSSRWNIVLLVVIRRRCRSLKTIGEDTYVATFLKLKKQTQGYVNQQSKQCTLHAINFCKETYSISKTYEQKWYTIPSAAIFSLKFADE